MQAGLILLMIGISGLQAQSVAPIEHPAPARNLWRASLVTMAATGALDVHSSWGKPELNPALAAPSRTFGRDGALIKLGILGSVIGIEYLITRRRPDSRLYRALAIVNFGGSAATGAVAIHNYTLPGAPH